MNRPISAFRSLSLTFALLTVIAGVVPRAEADVLRVLVAGGGTNNVLSFDAKTGIFAGTFVPPGSGGLTAPQDLTVGPDGKLYVSSFSNGSVKRYDGKTGKFLDAFVPSGSGGLAHPDQVAFGPDGNLYVSDRFSATIKRYKGGTGAFLGDFVSDSRLGGFVEFTFGPDGNIYAGMFNCCGDQRILRFNGTTGAFMDVFVTGAPFLDAAFAGLAFGPDGNLYASRFHGYLVERYNGTTGVFIDTFVSPGSGGLNTADELAFGPDGNLYVDSLGSNKILRYNGTTGAFINTFAPMSSPKGVLFAQIPLNVFGAVGGVHAINVLCWNATTRQSLNVVLGPQNWNCTAAGLQLSPGDSIVEVVSGVVN